jgi:hypothetical protein
VQYADVPQDDWHADAEQMQVRSARASAMPVGYDDWQPPWQTVSPAVQPFMHVA